MRDKIVIEGRHGWSAEIKETILGGKWEVWTVRNGHKTTDRLRHRCERDAIDHAHDLLEEKHQLKLDMSPGRRHLRR